MAFKPSASHEDIAEINMIPLIDVMLVLLVIFMLAAPLLNNKIPVQLPNSSGSQDASLKKNIISITMDAQGQVWVDGQPTAMEDLAPKVKARKQQGADQIHLNADKSVRYDVLAQVMSIAQKSGITKLGFVTKAGALQSN